MDGADLVVASRVSKRTHAWRVLHCIKFPSGATTADALPGMHGPAAKNPAAGRTHPHENAIRSPSAHHPEKFNFKPGRFHAVDTSLPVADRAT